jgi:hypothetical protein
VPLAYSMGSNCSKGVKPDCAAGDKLLIKKVRRNSTIGFIELSCETAGSNYEPLMAYLPQHALKACLLKLFRVETEREAWYMSVYGATREQCQDPYHQEHLCCVVCAHAHASPLPHSEKMYAASSILFLAQIHPHRYPHLTRFDFVLQQHSMLRKVVGKIHGCASRQGHVPQEDLSVQLAPCFGLGSAAPPESSKEIEATANACSVGAIDDDDELCIVCAHGKRNWRWSRCSHTTDGPSLICGQCKSVLLRAERTSQGIVDDNRYWVATRCIICNQRSDFLRCKPRKELSRPAGFVISNY